MVTDLRRWELVWEGPPPPNQNGAVSRWRTIKARQLWRANADILGKLAELPKREIVRYRVSVLFYRRSLQVADEDGDVSRLKSVLDGLIGELYLPDDTRRFVEWGAVEEARGRPGFVITLEELPHDSETARRAALRYARFDDVDPLARLRRRTQRAAPPATPRRTALPGGGASRRAARARRQLGLDPGR